MSVKSTAKPGRYNPDLTPWVEGMHEALDDPKVFEVVCRKSAQVAWTDGVLLNYIGRRIDIEPCAMIVMFSNEAAAKAFDREKFTPMVEVTPALASRIPVHKARDRDNAWDYKGFPGGFLKLVGSNSADSVKSTPAPFVAVEEPDDANRNLKGQGDAITILRERFKSFSRRKLVFGGTPTVEGFSSIDEAYKGSDQRQFWVACPHCQELQLLAVANIVWTTDPAVSHEVYGNAVPSSARYRCTHNGCLWTDVEKNRAVRRARDMAKAGVPGYGWRPSATFHGVAGFEINEAYSPFPGSLMARLVEKRLAAEHAMAEGDDRKLRSFRNNTEGLAYAYKSNVPAVDVLRDRAEDYPELSVPHGGLVLTCGVDVQHDRLAVVIRAWGRGEESWLVWWGEIPGRTMLVVWGDDGAMVKEQSGAWWDLDQLLMGSFPHANGARLRLRAGSFDSGDGQTQDAVYSYVRRRLQFGFMATKGESHDPKKDMFTPPKLSVDTNGRHKPHPSGVRPYMVGTLVGKDLVLGVDEQGGRIKLTGRGPGRMHWYRGVRPDYWDQITSEVKVPHKTVRGRMVWQCLAGRRNEALDCEILALHAGRSLKLNLWREDRWAAEESAHQQPALFADQAPAVQAFGKPTAAAGTPSDTAAASEPAAPLSVKKHAQPQPPRAGGWSAKRW